AARTTDRESRHVLPQEFGVDERGGVKEPVGMAGVRLEARVHTVAGSVGSGQNLIKCCNRAGLHVDDVLGSPLAAADAVLTPEERELGVALVEVGAGTTSTVVYHGGAIRHTAVLPVGGGHVTNDLAAALRTPFADAEKLKHRCGSALALAASPDLTVEVAGIGGGAAPPPPRARRAPPGSALALAASPDLTVEVAGIGGRPPHKLSQRALADVVEPRCEEVLALVRSEIERAGAAGHLTSGVVLTGGGAVLHGMTDLAERV